MTNRSSRVPDLPDLPTFPVAANAERLDAVSRPGSDRLEASPAGKWSQLFGHISQQLGRIADGQAEREGADAGTAAGAAAGDSLLSADPKPLALRHDGTIRGDAYDKAAQSSLAWRFKDALRGGIRQAFDGAGGDSAKFEGALADLKSRLVDAPGKSDPQYRDTLLQHFEDAASVYRRHLLAGEDAAAVKTRRRDAVAAIDREHADLVNQSRLAGRAGDPDGALGRQYERADHSLAEAERQGVLTPADARAKRRALARESAVARTEGLFAAMDTPEQQHDFARRLQAHIETGEPLHGLDIGESASLAARLEAKAFAARLDAFHEEIKARPEADILARLADLKPEDPLVEAATRASETVLRRRAEDPAGAVDDAFPEIGVAAASLKADDGEGHRRIVTQRLQAQDALGIPGIARNALPVEQVWAMVDAISGQPDDRAGPAMAGLFREIGSRYGEHAPLVGRQVLEAMGQERRRATAGAAVMVALASGDAPAARKAAAVADQAGEIDLGRVALGDAPSRLGQRPPPQKAVELLMRNPALAPDFERKYGLGTARDILRWQDPVRRDALNPGAGSLRRSPETGRRGTESDDGYIPYE